MDLSEDRDAVPGMLAWLYLANTVMLVVHEIDSAFWHEWDLLGLPGGIQTFLILHIPLLGLVLLGFRQVVLGRRGARAFSWALALIGIGAVSLHAILIAMGHPEFRQPMSGFVLGGILVISLLQILVLASSGRRRIRQAK